MEIQSRRLLMEAMEKRYRQASRAQKSRILDDVCELTDYHRKYAIRRIRRVEDCRPRPPVRLVAVGEEGAVFLVVVVRLAAPALVIVLAHRAGILPNAPRQGKWMARRAQAYPPSGHDPVTRAPVLRRLPRPAFRSLV